MPKDKPKFLENKLFFAILFLMSSVLLFSPLFFEIRLENIASLGLLGVALFNFVSSATLLLPAPGFLATGIGGSLYNPILVAIASAIGATLGEATGFIFGYSTKKMSELESHKYIKFLEKIIHDKKGSWLIVLLAFIPNPFFDIVGIIAGVALFPLRKFLILVFIGRFARDLIIAFAASQI